MQNKRVIVVAAVLMLLATALLWNGLNAPAASAVSEDSLRLIRVYGEAELSAAPDRAQIDLGVETSGATAQSAVGENARLMEAVLAALKQMGLQEDQLKTGAYQLYSEREYTEPTRPAGEGRITYRAINTLSITVNKLEDTGKIIDTAVRAGANQVQSIRFELKDAQALQRQALQAATTQAGTKARAIAATANVSIKGIHSIIEESASYTPFRAAFMDDMLKQEAAATTPVIPGDVNVHARVVVEYSF